MTADTISMARDTAADIADDWSEDQRKAARALLVTLANELAAARGYIKELERFAIDCDYCGKMVSIDDRGHLCEEAKAAMANRREERRRKREERQ